MNRNDLARRISSKLYLRLYVSNKVIDIICTETAKELRKEERVYLDKLGSFRLIKRPARKYYDPRIGKMGIKPSYKDVVFQPSKHLLGQIAKK